MARMGNPPTCKHFGWEDGKNVVVWAHLGEHYNHVKVVPLLHAWNTTPANRNQQKEEVHEKKKKKKKSRHPIPAMARPWPFPS